MRSADAEHLRPTAGRLQNGHSRVPIDVQHGPRQKSRGARVTTRECLRSGAPGSPSISRPRFARRERQEIVLPGNRERPRAPVHTPDLELASGVRREVPLCNAPPGNTGNRHRWVAASRAWSMRLRAARAGVDSAGAQLCRHGRRPTARARSSPLRTASTPRRRHQSGGELPSAGCRTSIQPGRSQGVYTGRPTASDCPHDSLQQDDYGPPGV
jgi:hypothetical protein